MSIYFLIFCFFTLKSLAMAQMNEENIQELMTYCGKDIPNLNEVLKKFSQTKQMNQEMKCFIGCLYQKKQILKNDGSFNQIYWNEFVKKIQDPNKKERMIQFGLAIKEAVKSSKSKCESGGLLFTYMEKMKKASSY